MNKTLISGHQMTTTLISGHQMNKTLISGHHNDYDQYFVWYGHSVDKTSAKVHLFELGIWVILSSRSLKKNDKEHS